MPNNLRIVSPQTEEQMLLHQFDLDADEDGRDGPGIGNIIAAVTLEVIVILAIAAACLH